MQKPLLVKPRGITHHEERIFRNVMQQKLHQQTQHGNMLGPLWTWIMVVPGMYFSIRYATSGDDYVKLPVSWLRNSGTERSLVRSYCSDNVFVFQKRINFYESLVENVDSVSSASVLLSDVSSPLQSDCCDCEILEASTCGGSVLIDGNPSSWPGRSGLVHRVQNITIESVSDEASVNALVPEVNAKKRKHVNEKHARVKYKDDNSRIPDGLEEVVTVGRRMFWTGTELSGCFDVMMLRHCLPAKDVRAFVLMECNSMHI